jgi:cytoskeletal protein RodZ
MGGIMQRPSRKKELTLLSISVVILVVIIETGFAVWFASKQGPHQEAGAQMHLQKVILK